MIHRSKITRAEMDALFNSEDSQSDSDADGQRMTEKEIERDSDIHAMTHTEIVRDKKKSETASSPDRDIK